jgi:vitamin B12 transporter
MRKLLLILIAHVFIYMVNAQTKVTGIVKDNKNHPIQGASITIKDSYDGATTDSSGSFSFRTAEKGERFITVSSIGYNGVEEKVMIGKETITSNFCTKRKTG